MPVISYFSVPAALIEKELLAGSSEISIGPYTVMLTSERIRTFSKGLSCVECGITGTFFTAQESYGQKFGPRGIPHFNLFAINEKGEEVLMTSDHIIPKSRPELLPKGMHIDSLNNRQPMCETCNTKKGYMVEGETVEDYPLFPRMAKSNAKAGVQTQERHRCINAFNKYLLLAISGVRKDFHINKAKRVLNRSLPVLGCTKEKLAILREELNTCLQKNLDISL